MEKSLSTNWEVWTEKFRPLYLSPKSSFSSYANFFCTGRELIKAVERTIIATFDYINEGFVFIIASFVFINATCVYRLE